MKNPTYNRARLEILSYIIQFCTYKDYNKKLNHIDEDYLFYSCYDEENELKKGDLVILGSVLRTNKWYLSWFIEERPLKDSNETEYLLKSVEDGSLCWWHNISLSYFNRNKLNQFKIWKFDDEQFNFQDKWNKAVYSVCSIHKPKLPIFNEDGSAIVSIRRMFEDETYKEFSVPNYKKATLTSLKKSLKEIL